MIVLSNKYPLIFCTFSILLKIVHEMERSKLVLVYLTPLLILIHQFNTCKVLAADTPGTENEQSRGEEASRILNSLLQDYDKRVRPNIGGPSVTVGITMYILMISSVSEINMDFTADFYFRQTWKDPRLQFKGPPGLTFITVAPEFFTRVWTPDTFFVNEKRSFFHTETVPNGYERISQDGDVFKSIRLTMTASCPMDLRYFPMDRQLCTIEIESFGYSMRDIRYKWAKGIDSIGVSSDVSLSQFRVFGHRSQTMEISLRTGNYSRLACEIMFVRSMGYYLAQVYLPAAIIVIISWVSFWINRDMAPARVSLGVSTLLTMITLISSTNASLPKITYIKAIDVYLGVCLIMVFAPILEYVTLAYMAKHIHLANKRLAKRKIATVGQANARCGQENPAESISPEKITNIFGIAPSDLDKYSRAIFPVYFVCFNACYWIFYLMVSNIVWDDIILHE